MVAKYAGGSVEDLRIVVAYFRELINQPACLAFNSAYSLQYHVQFTVNVQHCV